MRRSHEAVASVVLLYMCVYMCPHALYVSLYHYYYNHSLEDESREFPKGQTANLMILAMLDGLKPISLEDC